MPSRYVLFLPLEYVPNLLLRYVPFMGAVAQESLGVAGSRAPIPLAVLVRCGTTRQQKLTSSTRIRIGSRILVS